MVRGPISMVVVGVIGMAFVALVFGGPQVFARFLPDSALAWVEANAEVFGADISSLGGGRESGRGSDGTSAPDPMAELFDGRFAWRASEKIAALAGNKAAFVRDVIYGRRVAIGGDSPASVSVVAPMQGCTFTRRSADSYLGHVLASGGEGLHLGIITYDDSDLAGTVQQLARDARKGRFLKVDVPSELAYRSFDVAVTETAKPVYLVLQTSGANRMWNIHLAPGARLERAILLGGAQVGVANLPEGVPVEIMRDAEAAACGIPPAAYPLNPRHVLLRSIEPQPEGWDAKEEGLIDPEEARATLREIGQQMLAWNGWFYDAFQASPESTMAGNWEGNTIAVAGPVPASADGRAVWNPIDGASAFVTSDTYLDFGPKKEGVADFKARARAIADSFAWGDLKNLYLEEAF